jgi:hypothetical protein
MNVFYFCLTYDKILLDDTKEVYSMETSLIVRKESKLDKIIKLLNRMFFKEAYYLEEQLDELFKPKSVNVSRIVIPKEIKY